MVDKYDDNFIFWRVFLDCILRVGLGVISWVFWVNIYIYIYLHHTHLDVVLSQVGDDLSLVFIENLKQDGPSLAVLLQHK